MSTTLAIRCLVVEDNPRLREDLLFYLGCQGMLAAGVEDGVGLDRLLAQGEWDVVVLDLGLPGEDGLDIARRLASRPRLGVVILTARDRLEDRLAGWESGAHVYLVKPAPLEEVVAVVGAVYRRLHPVTDPAPEVAPQPWRFYPARRELVTPGGISIPLTHRERLLLSALHDAPQRRIGRDLALEQDAGSALDVLVHRLRRKLRVHGDPIRTVYGEGFVFEGELEQHLPTPPEAPSAPHG